MKTLKSLPPSSAAEADESYALHLLEGAIQALPEAHRVILVLREVEQLSVGETAAALGVSEATITARLLRAHAMLRRELHARARGCIAGLFVFDASRCDRVVKAAFNRMREKQHAGQFVPPSKLIQ